MLNEMQLCVPQLVQHNYEVDESVQQKLLLGEIMYIRINLVKVTKNVECDYIIEMPSL